MSEHFGQCFQQVRVSLLDFQPARQGDNQLIWLHAEFAPQVVQITARIRHDTGKLTAIPDDHNFLCRETLVTFVLRPIALSRGVVIPASVMGKVKTVLQFLAMLLVLATLVPETSRAWLLTSAAQVSFFAVLGFSVVSAAKYGFDWVTLDTKTERAAANRRAEG